MQKQRNIFIGYKTSQKAYRFCSENKKLTCSRSSGFCKNANWNRIHGFDTKSDFAVPLSGSGDANGARQEGKCW